MWLYEIGVAVASASKGVKPAEQELLDRLAGVPNARPIPRGSISACTYAMPQVASVGLTEEAAAIVATSQLPKWPVSTSTPLPPSKP